METAILGLIGVIVGAAITSTWEFVMQRREDRFAQRAAMRLLAMDFHKTLAVTSEVARTGRWGPERGPLPDDAYVTHGSTLARVLPSRPWKTVEGAVLGVRRLEGIRQEMLAENRRASAEELADFRRIRAFLDKALLHVDTEMSAIERDNP